VARNVENTPGLGSMAAQSSLCEVGEAVLGTTRSPSSRSHPWRWAVWLYASCTTAISSRQPASDASGSAAARQCHTCGRYGDPRLLAAAAAATCWCRCRHVYNHQEERAANREFTAELQAERLPGPVLPSWYDGDGALVIHRERWRLHAQLRDAHQLLRHVRISQCVRSLPCTVALYFRTLSTCAVADGLSAPG
jgi:hypothetical protein